jgi:hypothetical protein
LEFGGTGGIIGEQCGGRSVKGNDHHPGITMHKIPVGGGVAGLIFTIGSIAIFLAGLPAFWYVLVLAVALGIGIAIVLRLVHS